MRSFIEAPESGLRSGRVAGSIPKVIRGIVGQTNLLALDAAMEAARAGCVENRSGPACPAQSFSLEHQRLQAAVHA
ncbi:hypothetical protein JTA32_17220 [Pseudomonas sp. 20GA0148]|nr:hypothetical protein [Pseudomonas alliivorans]